MRSKNKTALSWAASLTASSLAFALVALAAQPATAAASLPEYQVTTSIIYDYHFDWGANGCYCPTCNHGQGNARLTFTDNNDNLWLANVDPNTGLFSPSNGMGTLVDTDAAYVNDFGDGAYWMFSSTHDSQITYTKYTPGQPHSAATANAGVATMNPDGTWTGTIAASDVHAPLGTQDLTDPSPAINFQDQNDTEFLWQLVSDPSTEQMVPYSNRGHGNSRRWVQGAHTIVYTAAALPDATGKSYVQVFTYDTTTFQQTQLTFEPTNKSGAWMWRAPEFNNDYVFFTVVGKQLSIYHQQPDSSGNLVWTNIKTVTMPTSMPYIWSPVAFVYNGKSYIFFQLSSYSGNQSWYFNVPTQIAMTGIDPAVNSFKWLTNNNLTKRVRSNPEYYVTSKGVYIYYNRFAVTTPTNPTIHPDGVWYVPANLGAPSGNLCSGMPTH